MPRTCTAAVRGLASLACLGAAALAACGSPVAPPPEAALRALRAGHHVLYLRHTRADVGQDSPRDGTWWTACGTGHRMLSDQGRVDAQLIGQALRALRVPVGELRASEYCRARQTAHLLDVGEPQTDPRLNAWPVWQAADPERGVERHVRATRELLTAPVARGNRVLVAHKQDVAAPAHPALSSLADGEAAVFRPGRGEDLQLVGRIRVADWARLVSGPRTGAR